MILDTLEISVPGHREPITVTVMPPLSIDMQPGERLTLFDRCGGFDLLFPCGRVVPIDVIAEVAE